MEIFMKDLYRIDESMSDDVIIEKVETLLMETDDTNVDKVLYDIYANILNFKDTNRRVKLISSSNVMSFLRFTYVSKLFSDKVNNLEENERTIDSIFEIVEETEYCDVIIDGTIDKYNDFLHSNDIETVEDDNYKREYATEYLVYKMRKYGIDKLSDIEKRFLEVNI